MNKTAILKIDIKVPDIGEDYLCPKGTKVELLDLRTLYDEGNEVIEALYPNGVSMRTPIDALRISRTIQLDRSLYLDILDEEGDNMFDSTKEEQSNIDWEQRKWELYKIGFMDNRRAESGALMFANRAIKAYKEDKE